MRPDVLPPSPNLALEHLCCALGQRLLALLHEASPPGDGEALGGQAPAGLRRALGQAQALLVCAQGPAYWAALSVRPSFFAVAQLPVLIERPQALEGLGVGLWRLPGLLTWLSADGEQAGGQQALALAQRYGCPALLLGGAPAPGQALKGSWAMAQGPAAEGGGAFMLAVVLALMLARLAASERLSALGPQAALEAAALGRLQEALLAAPEHVTALGQHLGPRGPGARAVERVAGWLGRARQVFVLCDNASLHAAQAWSAQRPQGGPRALLCPLDDPALPPPWADMGPDDLCVVICRGAPGPAAQHAAAAQSLGAAAAWVTAAGADVPEPSDEACALSVPDGPQALWPLSVYGLLLALG